MLTPRAAFAPDRRGLPPAGSIVLAKVDRILQHGFRWRRFRVESFPLGALRNCATLTALDTGQRVTVAAQYLEVLE